MDRLTIRLLGPFQVTLDGEPVTRFESDKVRALLAYLAVETGKPHRREKLAGLLWPELPERSARTNLRVALTNLRRVIGDRAATPGRRPTPPFLCITRQTIQFDEGSNAWTDVATITQLLAAKGRPQRVIAKLEEAAALYRGSFLEGFSLPDSPAFEEWALLERERLLRQVVAALHGLARWYESRGEIQQALPHASRLAELEPWQEEGQRRFMRLLALCGHRNLALAQYLSLRQELARELGVEPEDKTTALYERIRSGRAFDALSSHPPPNNLPAPLTPFIGRERELDEIYARLQEPGCRLLSLVGPGGSGKTRLALEAAADLLSVHALASNNGHDIFCPAHGVFFIPLAPLRATEAVVSTIAKILGFSFHGAHDPQEQLLDYLRQKRLLLILDNFEQLLTSSIYSASRGEEARNDISPVHEGDSGGSALVAEILRAAPGVKICITSRARLGMQAEQLFPVAGMRTPESESGLDALDYEAIRLFRSGAQRIQLGFEITGDNQAGVVQLCRLVEAMPLAILLSAAWVDQLSPAGIAARLSGQIGQGLDLLETDWSDIPARQRGMRATFEYSWKLLDVSEQEILQGLSVFRGGFSTQAARQVAGASSDALVALAHRSLLERPATDRYRVHELLRQFLAEKLRRSPAAGAAVRDQHSAHYTLALEHWGADLKGERQQAAMAEMEANFENASAAWTWAVEHGQVDRLGAAMEGLGLFLQWRGRYREGIAACQLAVDWLTGDAGLEEDSAPPLAKLQTARSGDCLQVLARILAWQGAFLEALGRTEEARLQLQWSLSLLEVPSVGELDTRSARAFSSLQMGHTLLLLDSAKARQFYEQSLTLYQDVGDRWGTAAALYALGDVAWYQGDYEKCRRLCEECLALRRQSGDRRGIAEALVALSNTLPRLGQVKEGVLLGKEGVVILQELGGRAAAVHGLGELATALAFNGQYAESQALFEKALSIRVDLGTSDADPNLTMALGHIEMHLGWYEQTKKRAKAALSLGRNRGHLRTVGNALYLLGGLALIGESYSEARELLQESVAASRSYGQQGEMGRHIATLGYSARGMGNAAEARYYFREALQIGAELGAMLPVWWALPGVALLLLDAGEPERAVEFDAMATSFPVVGNSRWFRDLAGQYIAAAANSLPRELVNAAQVRGQNRDLDTTVSELIAELSS